MNRATVEEMRWRAARMVRMIARSPTVLERSHLVPRHKEPVKLGQNPTPAVGIVREASQAYVRESGRAQRTQGMTFKFVSIPAVVLAATTLAAAPAFAQR